MVLLYRLHTMTIVYSKIPPSYCSPQHLELSVFTNMHRYMYLSFMIYCAVTYISIPRMYQTVV